MGTREKVRRYHAACDRYHEQRTPPSGDDVTVTWAALPLWARLREILTVPWRDAVDEVRSAWTKRGRR